MEWLLASKEKFTKADIGIPAYVKQMMYSGQWDKLLVDVRRSVKVAGRDGKTDSYTATVCVGNFKVSGC